jgi:hypothetical protein
MEGPRRKLTDAVATWAVTGSGVDVIVGVAAGSAVGVADWLVSTPAVRVGNKVGSTVAWLRQPVVNIVRIRNVISKRRTDFMFCLPTVTPVILYSLL